MRVSLPIANAASTSSTSNIKDTISIPGFDSIIGETTLEKESTNGTLIPVNLFVAKKTDKPNRFYIVDTAGKEVGWIDIHLHRSGGTNQVYGVNGKYKTFPGAAFGSDMYNLDGNFKGIGTALHRMGVELSDKAGFKGRYWIQTARSSHIFHSTFGFRSMSWKHSFDNEQIEEKIQEAKAQIKAGVIKSTKQYDTYRLGHMDMFLPEEIAQEYLQMTPILYKNIDVTLPANTEKANAPTVCSFIYKSLTNLDLEKLDALTEKIHSKHKRYKRDDIKDLVKCLIEFANYPPTYGISKYLFGEIYCGEICEIYDLLKGSKSLDEKPELIDSYFCNEVSNLVANVDSLNSLIELLEKHGPQYIDSNKTLIPLLRILNKIRETVL